MLIVVIMGKWSDSIDHIDSIDYIDSIDHIDSIESKI